MSVAHRAERARTWPSAVRATTWAWLRANELSDGHFSLNYVLKKARRKLGYDADAPVRLLQVRDGGRETEIIDGEDFSLLP